MLKYVFLALYFLIAIYLYKLFADVLDKIKASFDANHNNIQSKTTKGKFNFLCDLVYIVYMLAWPIFMIHILIEAIQRKETNNVHKSENQGRDGEGSHKD